MLGPETRPEHERARATVRRIVEALEGEGKMLDEIVEFVSGMTDRFALSYAARLED